MREYKFRAWDKSIGMMIHGISVAETGWIGRDGSFACNNEYVMQYTGLKDKKGKEIYEGDILKHDIKTSICFPFVMEWDEKKAKLTDFAPRNTIKVIGNIYENPELLDK